MRGWRGGAAALLVAAVLLPAPLLLKRRAAAPADEWRRADVDRALAGADDEPPWRRDDEDVDRALAPRRRLGTSEDLASTKRSLHPTGTECSAVQFERKAAINDLTVNKADKYVWFQVRAADIDGDGTDDVVAVETKEVNELHWYETDASTATFTNHKITEFADQEGGFGVAVVDLDGDSDVDILVAAEDEEALCWYENGGGSWTRHAIEDDEDKELSLIHISEPTRPY